MIMTRKELERKLEQLGCLDWYSLDGSLCSDRRILYENYSVWEYFYMDERGNRTPLKLFTSAEKAYDYYKNALDSCNVFQTALNKRPSSLRPSDLRRAGFPLIWPARSFRIVAWL